MSLLNRSGLDTKSWLLGVKASAPTILTGILGILLAWLGLRVVWSQGDKALTFFLYTNGSNNPVPRVFDLVADAGNVIWIPLVFWLFVLRQNKNEWISAGVLAVAVVASTVSVEILKVLFQLPRPFVAYPSDFSGAFEHPTNYAFPSGHTTMAFTVLAVIWKRYRAWRVPFLALALATGVGLMIIGIHFLSDVIAGACVGTIWGVFATSLARLRGEAQPVTL